MSDIVERLKEKIITDAFVEGLITSGALAERLIRERLDAADEIEKLREALKPFADAVTDEYSWKYDINSDDFRAAAAALGETDE